MNHQQPAPTNNQPTYHPTCTQINNYAVCKNAVKIGSVYSVDSAGKRQNMTLSHGAVAPTGTGSIRMNNGGIKKAVGAGSKICFTLMAGAGSACYPLTTLLHTPPAG